MSSCASGVAGRPTRLWREALDDPGVVRLTAVAQPVVQAILATLPELDTRGNHAVPAPEWWSRDLPAVVAALQLLVPRFQLRTTWENRALLRGPRAQAAAFRAA